MKKLLVRVLLLISFLILGYQQFAYADMYIPDPLEEFEPIATIIGVVGTSVAVVSVLSYFSLKQSAKRNEVAVQTGEEDKKINPEYVAKKAKKTKIIVVICATIVSVLAYIYGLDYHSDKLYRRVLYSDTNESFTIVGTKWEYCIFIPVAMYVVAIIFRLFKKKKVAKVIWTIALIIITVVTLWNVLSIRVIKKNIDKYRQYEKSYDYRNLHINDLLIFSPYYVVDMKGLINEVIKSNSGIGRNITLIYEDIEYKSVKELKQLLEKIDFSKRYFVVNNFNEDLGYIRTMTFIPANQRLYKKLSIMTKKEQSASSIESLYITLNNENEYGAIIDLMYISETGEEIYTDFRYDTYDDYNRMNGIIASNKGTGQMYSLELLTDEDRPCDIIIRPISTVNSE